MVGSGSQRSVAPAPTVTSRSSEDGLPDGPGSTIDAATLRTVSAASAARSTASRSSSPPTGPAALPTRCTRPGPVARSVSGGADRSVVQRVRPAAAPRSATIVAQARTGQQPLRAGSPDPAAPTGERAAGPPGAGCPDAPAGVPPRPRGA